MVLLRHSDSKRTAKLAWILVLFTVLPVVATIAAVAILARRANHLQPPSPLPLSPQRERGRGEGDLDRLPLNAAADVPYMGDESCARCHPGIAQTYHRHPMARSFAPITMVQDSSRRADQFERTGFQFLIERGNGKIVHKASRLDAERKVIYQSEAPVSFFVGAGIRGRSYLIDRQGYLFQSPISWYAERQAWDLSPHLGGSLTQLYRPVQPLCLYCHADRVEPVEHTGNCYRGSLFAGQGIGCERCHGPGQLHVERHNKSAAVPLEEEAIVHPGRLSPALREAVCQQCHLQGLVRIARRGRQLSDYRPGLPVSDFWSVFVKSAALDQQKKFSSEVEQMYASRCYRDSGGRLGCISCHDPHQTPAKEEKGRYYRERCLTCHQENSCGLPDADRRKQSLGDSCIDCHMKPRTSNLVHMASADHRIPLRPEGSDQEFSMPSGRWLTELERSPESALVSFPEGQSHDPSIWHSGHPNREMGRDFGLALMDLAGLKVPQSLRRRLAEYALPLLTSSLESWPDDVAARQGKGYALWLLDRKPEALAAFEQTLAAAPRREEALVYAAAVAAQLGQTDSAIKLWRRAVDVNPWSPRSHYELAKLLAHDHRWPEALAQVEKALDLDPFQLEAQLLRIECHLELGHTEQAGKEFDDVVWMAPEKARDLNRWFDERKARARIKDR